MSPTRYVLARTGLRVRDREPMNVNPEQLDPIRSMADLARLMARLAEPFAKQDDVLRHANVTQATLDAAKTKWLAELSGNERLAQLYGEIHLLERAELRGEPKPAPRVAAPAETAAAAPLPKRSTRLP